MTSPLVGLALLFAGVVLAATLIWWVRRREATSAAGDAALFLDGFWKVGMVALGSGVMLAVFLRLFPE